MNESATPNPEEKGAGTPDALEKFLWFWNGTAQAAKGPHEKHQPFSAAARLSPSDFQSMTPLSLINSPRPILLVEDDSNDVFLMQRLFQKSHLLNPVVVASDGETALDYLQRSLASPRRFPSPMLVLLDLKLPRQSGTEVLRGIRRNSQFDGMPVVLLTGSGDMAEVQSALEIGANSCLSKPVGLETFLKLMSRLSISWMLLPEKIAKPA